MLSVSFPSLPSLLPPAPFRSLCHLNPFSASLLPQYHSTYASLSFSRPSLDLSSSRSLPIDLTVYLSICLSLEAPRAARATCTAATLKERCRIGRRRCPDERRQPIPEDADGDTALSFSLPHPSSFYFFPFLSPCLFLSPEMNAGGGWWRAAAKDALSLAT